MRHSLQEREISTVCLPCLLAPQLEHYTRTHKSTQPGTRSYQLETLEKTGHCQSGKSQVIGPISHAIKRQTQAHKRKVRRERKTS